MFATCLFCNAALGANESIEHFPVGRRLAFDSAKGRLWVVCKQCERWNLSPLESRWEAIDEAERAFRSTRMRIATDNIGLARLRDGTELVRIGVPPRLEFAVWRYGDQFGKRHRKAWMWTATAATLGFIPLAGNLWGGAAISIAASGVSLVQSLSGMYASRRAKSVPMLSVRDNDGKPLRLTAANATTARLVAVGRNHKWALEVGHIQAGPAKGLLKSMRNTETTVMDNPPALLTGIAAERALAVMMPRVNGSGGSKRQVRSAVDLINTSASIGHMLRSAPVHGGNMSEYFKLDSLGIPLFRFPGPIRLALEMSLHEDDERRAMEGELHELEVRWREADAIARIADGMFLPDDMDERIGKLRNRDSSLG